MERWLKSIHDTVLDCGNSAALAEEVGLTRNDLMNRANPEIDRGNLSPTQYYKLLKATRDFRSLHTLAAAFGFHLCVSEQGHSADGDAIAVLLMMTTDLGNVSLYVTEALKDRRFSPNERRGINPLIDAMRARINALDAAVNGRGV